MYRPSLCLFLSLWLAPGGRSAPVPWHGPTSNEIKQAIEDLGSKSFSMRDKAKKLLFEAGEGTKKSS